MLKNLISVDKAKKKIKYLQKYINLAENYEVHTIEKWIIREYAYTNSMKKVVKHASEQGKTTEMGNPVDLDYVRLIINSKPNDELHRIVRLGYRKKVRKNDS